MATLTSTLLKRRPTTTTANMSSKKSHKLNHVENNSLLTSSAIAAATGSAAFGNERFHHRQTSRKGSSNGSSEKLERSPSVSTNASSFHEACCSDILANFQNTTDAEKISRTSVARAFANSSDRGGCDEDICPCCCCSEATDYNMMLKNNNSQTKLEERANFVISLKFDLVALFLFVVAFCTRFYKLSTPNNVVFDELHYGKYISLYIRNIFFFDQHPPLGKQLIAAVSSFAGYDGNYTFPRIGSAYTQNVPVFWLRFLPALCGSLLSPVAYKLLLEIPVNRWTALLGGLLIILDNSLLTQSRFILMESMLLLFTSLGLLHLLRFQKSSFASPRWIISGLASASFFAFALSVKYVGFYSGCLAFYLMCRYLWNMLYDASLSDFQIILQAISRALIFSIIPIGIYIGVFYLHLNTLTKAGPHDNVMTSAFQASLEGGLASITKGQPLIIVHGSQITLRHTHGRACWLHSHAHVYPVKYPDKRGSSHQQQVTCYSFKDVNNWWIVKRPNKEELVVGDEMDPIKDGDIVQLVHGITSRALNSHDVAAPMSPSCQEVTCYIDYEINMEGQLLWRVEILNKDTEGQVWHAIKSQIRLIHVNTGVALRFSGKQLPEWGFNQHEVVGDRIVNNKDAIWNVEEHRYTKTQDQRERERQLLNAEMIPTQKTKLSFLEKFFELHSKMLWSTKNDISSHMYSSEPLEWPLLDKGIAYWVDKKSNGQIHLLGNVLTWYSATAAIFVYFGLLAFYLVRRQRLAFDLPQREWQRFLDVGDIFVGGYLIHYLPYFFVDRTLFLHNYMPSLLFKMLLLCYIVEHVDYLLRRFTKNPWIVRSYRLGVILWVFGVFHVFKKLLPLTYGIDKLTGNEIAQLRWKDTWDLIVHKELAGVKPKND